MSNAAWGRWRGAALAALVAVAVAGCTAMPAAPAPTSTFTPAEVVALLEEVAGVVDVEQFGEPIPGEPGAGELTGSIGIDVAVAASGDEVLAAAASIAQIATDVGWEGNMSLSRENLKPYDAERDVSVPAAWTLEVVPATARVADDLAQLLLLEKLDDTASLTVIDGWPYVSLSSIDTFAQTFSTVVANPLFVDGGTVSLASDDRLRIVWVPTRTSLAAVEAIVAISRDYPGAEVLLEAMTAGPQWPTLYIARVSEHEAAAIEARLLDPALADADVDGYGLPFILRSIGEGGPTYRDGNFGGVIDPS